MRYLRDAESIPYPGIRDLVRQRITELSEGEPFDPELMGSLILVEPGDTPASLEAGCGCLITTGLFVDAKDPDFMPCFEWLEHHPQGHCYEMLFIMTDDGIGTALFIPDAEGIDPQLLAFCRQYATPAFEVK